jgi:peptidoglycan hydrolase-like protein with peptidoglycan-binding domain
MLLYSDDNLDRQLSDKVAGITGITGPDTKTILMLSSEASAQLKQGQSVGTINSILQLYGEDNDDVQLPDGAHFSEADLH